MQVRPGMQSAAVSQGSLMSVPVVTLVVTNGGQDSLAHRRADRLSGAAETPVIRGRIDLEQHLGRCPPAQALNVLEWNASIAKPSGEGATKLMHPTRSTIWRAVGDAAALKDPHPCPRNVRRVKRGAHKRGKHVRRLWFGEPRLGTGEALGSLRPGDAAEVARRRVRTAEGSYQTLRFWAERRRALSARSHGPPRL